MEPLQGQGEIFVFPGKGPASLQLFDGVADDGLPLLRWGLPGVGKVNFMVQALIRQVVFVAVLLQILVHQGHRRRLAIVGAQVHELDAEALVDGEKFRRRAVQLFLPRRLFPGPLEVGLGDEIGQTDDREPVEAGLAGVIDAVDALLPPKALQRRDHILKKPSILWSPL